jgi:hypothetical protein
MPALKVFCSGCSSLLLKYTKAGRGALVKLHPRRVSRDRTADGLHCPFCDAEFARRTIIGGQRFRKLLGGKVFVKGGVSVR